MSLEVSIEGAAAYHRVARQMLTEGRKDLSRQMGTALSKAAEPVKVSIRAEAEKVMPSGGGYRDVLTGSLKHRISRRSGGQQARVLLTTYASGTKERRDIVALNRGSLRHPIFGRSYKLRTGNRAGTIRRNGWAVTRIRPGFHDRGVDDAMDLAVKQLSAVVDDFTERLIT